MAFLPDKMHSRSSPEVNFFRCRNPFSKCNSCPAKLLCRFAWESGSMSPSSHLECLLGRRLLRECMARRTSRSPYTTSYTSQASIFHWVISVWKLRDETEAVKWLLVQGQLHSCKLSSLLVRLLIIWLANGLTNHPCCEVCLPPVLGSQSLFILGLGLLTHLKVPRHVDSSACRRDMGKVHS